MEITVLFVLKVMAIAFFVMIGICTFFFFLLSALILTDDEDIEDIQHVIKREKERDKND